MAGKDGRTIARDAVRQLKDFFSAVLELPAAFDALDARERAVEEKERRWQENEAAATAATTRRTEAEQSQRTAEERSGEAWRKTKEVEARLRAYEDKLGKYETMDAMEAKIATLTVEVAALEQRGTVAAEQAAEKFRQTVGGR